MHLFSLHYTVHVHGIDHCYCVHPSPPILLRCLHVCCELFAFTCFFAQKRLGLALLLSLCVGCFLQGYQNALAPHLHFDRPTTQTIAHRHSPRAFHELVCLVLAPDPFHCLCIAGVR